jgi:hypothetical protein
LGWPRSRIDVSSCRSATERSAVWYAPESGIIFALGVNQAATDPNKLARRVFDAVLTHQGR